MPVSGRAVQSVRQPGRLEEDPARRADADQHPQQHRRAVLQHQSTVRLLRTRRLVRLPHVTPTAWYETRTFCRRHRSIITGPPTHSAGAD